MGGRKRRQSTSSAAVAVAAAGCAPGYANPPLGREGAELGVAAPVVPSSPPLSGAELSAVAVAAARRELSGSPRRECGWRG